MEKIKRSERERVGRIEREEKESREMRECDCVSVTNVEQCQVSLQIFSTMN